MKEKKLLILTAILNLITASIKLVLGIIFSFSTLIGDSVQSFLDFFTDVISIFVNKIGKRRANKTYPFGYGQVYYISNLFTGILLFLIGIFITYQLLFVNNSFTPNIIILYVLLFVIALKSLSVILIQRCIKITKNELLVESYKESKADLTSTCVVVLILILSFFEKYIPSYINIDKIGSMFMAIYIFYTSTKIIISNIRGILVNDEENDEIKESIKKEFSHFSRFKVVNIRIIKMSYYYSAFIQIDVNDDVTIKEFLKMEKQIKKHLKSSNKMIKYIDIDAF